MKEQILKHFTDSYKEDCMNQFVHNSETDTIQARATINSFNRGFQAAWKIILNDIQQMQPDRTEIDEKFILLNIAKMTLTEINSLSNTERYELVELFLKDRMKNEN